MPPKTLIAPSVLRGSLGHIFIAERDGDDYRFRLFGTKAAETLHRDITGYCLSDILSGEDLNHVRSIFDRCHDDQAIVATSERLLEKGREYTLVEILRCPFADDAGRSHYVAGTFTAFGHSGDGYRHKVLEQRELVYEHDVLDRLDIPVV